MAMFRVTVVAFIDINDGETRDRIRNGIVALRDKLLRANAVESSYIEVQKCYHDEIPPKPCEVLYRWDKE